MSASQRPKHDSPFSQTELVRWRQELVDKMRSLCSDLRRLDGDEKTLPSGRLALTSNHLAERATDLQIDEIEGTSAAAESELLWQVERAIAKIDTSEPVPFGLCEESLSPIERERLELMPWTPYSAATSARIEAEGLGFDALLCDA